MGAPKRQRAQIRRKPVVADSSTALDLSNVKPHLPLKARGKQLWEYYAAETPFWWNAADIPTFAKLCALADDIATARKNGTSAAGIAALSKEERNRENELGLSPTSRSRLRLTEAQSTMAAKRAEAMGDRQTKQAIDLDDLVDDG